MSNIRSSPAADGEGQLNTADSQQLSDADGDDSLEATYSGQL